MLAPKRLKLRSRAGCLACKLRKRKCCETKPVCTSCQHTGQECQWLSRLSATDRQKYEHKKQHGDKIEMFIKDQEHSTRISIGITQNKEDVQIAFLLTTMFRGANTSCSGLEGNALTVQTELQFATTTDTLTWQCLDAMAKVYWGSVKKDQHTLYAGYKARGASLARLRDALAQDASSLSADLVAAVSLARLFESMIKNAKSQWILHAQGLARLFEAMGPTAFNTPTTRRLVENNRWVMIMSSSALRQPSMLDSHVWKTVPWHDARKDMLQRLLDVYARLPGIHSAWDKYIDLPCGEQQVSAEVKLIMQLRLVILEMHAWRSSVNTEIRQSVKTCSALESDRACPWRTSISFERLHHGYAIALYNTMLIALSRYVHRFPQAGDSVAGPVPSVTHYQPLYSTLLPLGDVFKRAALAAGEIAALTDWMLQDGHRGAGALYLAGPMVVSYQF